MGQRTAVSVLLLICLSQAIAFKSTFHTQCRITVKNQCLSINHVDRLQLNPEDLDNSVRSLNSPLARYNFLRNLLLEKVGIEHVVPVVALSAGFRTAYDDDGIKFIRQNNSLSPSGWEGIDTNDILKYVSSLDVRNRFANDLPPSDDATDMLIESLVGDRMTQKLKRTRKPLLKGIVTLVRWLYIFDFLGDEFPARERFTPGHMELG